MHDGMPHDPIQGQGQGHETFKVRKIIERGFRFWQLFDRDRKYGL